MTEDTPKLDTPLRATLAGIRSRFAGTGSRTLDADERLDGKLVLITGANRGLGLGIAERLARLGATLLLGCRSGGEEAVKDLSARTGRTDISAVPLDLTDRRSVADLVAELVRFDRVLDRVVLNAGTVTLGSRQTPAGLDTMFHVNFLGNVDLVEELVDWERIARDGARIVFVSSESHRSGEPDLERFGVPETYDMSGVMTRYGTSKLYLTAYAMALSEVLPADQIGVFAVCPGAVDSDIAREAPGWMKPLLKPTMKLLFQSPIRAAEPIAWLCTATELAGQTGRYHHMHAHKEPASFAARASTSLQLREAALALLERIR